MSWGPSEEFGCANLLPSIATRNRYANLSITLRYIRERRFTSSLCRFDGNLIFLRETPHESAAVITHDESLACDQAVRARRESSSVRPAQNEDGGIRIGANGEVQVNSGSIGRGHVLFRR